MHECDIQQTPNLVRDVCQLAYWHDVILQMYDISCYNPEVVFPPNEPQGGHTSLKVLEKKLSIFPGPEKYLKTEWGLESFGICCKRSLKVLELQYFIIIVTACEYFALHT